VFLPAHVASVAFLACARHLVISGWQVARKGMPTGCGTALVAC
jgi:hypothetical protein